jgi:hypothetical protein
LTKSVENGNLSLNDLVVDIFRIRVSTIRFHVLWGRGTGLGEEIDEASHHDGRFLHFAQTEKNHLT